jgi:hypothetical protein
MPVCCPAAGRLRHPDRDGKLDDESSEGQPHADKEIDADLDGENLPTIGTIRKALRWAEKLSENLSEASESAEHETDHRQVDQRLAGGA